MLEKLPADRVIEEAIWALDWALIPDNAPSEPDEVVAPDTEAIR